ncbi:hypothetical protein INR49_009277 [Caranx melampygus]|nr:hypothetical protein INR49_009277 [Caranx melampygus]
MSQVKVLGSYPSARTLERSLNNARLKRRSDSAKGDIQEVTEDGSSQHSVLEVQGVDVEDTEI